MRRRAKRNPREEIPEGSRRDVAKRQDGKCARCGMHGTDWHHRRRRNVRDGHEHCACNGVLLCRADHKWVHDNPAEAKALGWIVLTTDLPASVPVRTVWGWQILTHGPLSAALRDEQVQVGPLGRPVLL